MFWSLVWWEWLQKWHEPDSVGFRFLATLFHGHQQPVAALSYGTTGFLGGSLVQLQVQFAQTIWIWYVVTFLYFISIHFDQSNMNLFSNRYIFQHVRYKQLYIKRENQHINSYNSANEMWHEELTSWLYSSWKIV